MVDSESVNSKIDEMIESLDKLEIDDQPMEQDAHQDIGLQSIRLPTGISVESIEDDEGSRPKAAKSRWAE